MIAEDEVRALAGVIHESFWFMQGGDGPSNEEYNAGDAQLAYDILVAGYHTDKEMEQRELHHFETEQKLIAIQNYIEACGESDVELEAEVILDKIGEI